MEINSKLCADRFGLISEFEFYFHFKPFSISYIDVIQLHKTSDLYLYLGIFGGIVAAIPLIFVVSNICKYLVNKECREKETIPITTKLI